MRQVGMMSPTGAFDTEKASLPLERGAGGEGRKATLHQP